MPLHYSSPGWRPQTLAVGLLLVLLSGASQAETWVITDKAHPVSATGSSRVLFLDAQEHLEEQLSCGLAPGEPHRMLKRRLSDCYKAPMGAACRQSWS
ncbi:DUF1525 domain-containing protein, partial [Pseudomonas aeruginosa]|uniref:DUF1525 domain-containing protein n=1 Tax=Pseudomonas aeruginosa TaxID=287 RepID=UPI003AB026BC